MKIALIHGANHMGSTYHIARMLAEKIGGEITEFFLPRDFGEFCIGCTQCFYEKEEKCPHHEKRQPVTEAMDAADLIVLDSPVYVMHATGAMKALLDHYGYRFMIHRPEGVMFKKQAVCISTAAGAGMRSTMKDMADSCFHWGIAKTYRLGVAVRATSWDKVSDKLKASIEKKTDRLAAKIKRRSGNVKPGLITRAYFSLIRLVQKNGFNPADKEYWYAKGWTANVRPWK